MNNHNWTTDETPSTTPDDIIRETREYASVVLVGTIRKKQEGTTKRGTKYIRGSLRVRTSANRDHFFPFCAFDEKVVNAFAIFGEDTKVKVWGSLEHYRPQKQNDDGTPVSFVQIKIENIRPVICDNDDIPI